jgi:hypothetical protein
MQRPVTTVAGEDVAAFTVVRVERGEMAEGRIQMLRHRTEHTVWQPRWLTHPNGALGLLDVVIETADPDEAAQRYTRFLGQSSKRNAYGHYIQLDRGRVHLTARKMMRGMLPDSLDPAAPFISAYAIRVQSLERLQHRLGEHGLRYARRGRVVMAPFPEPLGLGTWTFVEAPADLPWRVD